MDKTTKKTGRVRNGNFPLRLCWIPGRSFCKVQGIRWRDLQTPKPHGKVFKWDIEGTDSSVTYFPPEIYSKCHIMSNHLEAGEGKTRYNRTNGAFVPTWKMLVPRTSSRLSEQKFSGWFVRLVLILSYIKSHIKEIYHFCEILVGPEIFKQPGSTRKKNFLKSFYFQSRIVFSIFCL